MHCKTIIQDEAVALIGDVNFTNNGIENCEGTITITKVLPVVTEVLQFFHTIWKEARPLELADMGTMQSKLMARKVERNPRGQ